MYSWYKGENFLKNTTQDHYLIEAMTKQTEGLYRCVAYSLNNKEQSEIVLNLICKLLKFYNSRVFNSSFNSIFFCTKIPNLF